MNNNHTTDHWSDEEIRTEIEDRLMDTALEEVLGGVTPDQLDRQQPAVALAPVSTEEPEQETGRSRRTNLLASLLAIGMCICVGVILQSGVFVPENESVNDHIVMSEAQMNELSPTLQSASFNSISENDPSSDIDDVLSFQTQTVREEQKNSQLQIDYEKMAEQNLSISSGQLSKLTSTNEQLSSELEALRDGASPQKFQNHFWEQPTLGKEVTTAPAQNGRGLGVTESRAKRPAVRGYETESKSGSVLTDDYGVALDIKNTRGVTTVDYLRTDATQVPLGWRKSTMKWEDGHWAFNPQTDGLEGVGPGNSGDNYAPIIENEFQAVTDSPLSTFSIDVDTASYSNTRRMLTQNNMLPPPDAVRIEEMINYFNYNYPAPVGDDPFSVTVEAAECPWQSAHTLVRIGLKGKEIPLEEKPASNLVFLLDVSGSMNQPNKIELLKSCLKMMVDYLGENDSIAIVTYASGTHVVLPSTSGDQKSVIMNALDNLRAGGSTNGAAGIQLAYEQATKNFIPGGINRVILATDGDFNVGITSQGDLHRMIEEKAKSNVFLTTLGFGFGNLQDNTIELLADKGNGNYSYIDTLQEGRKVLIDEMGSTLHTIAKDVKLQLEFNPVEVAAYRLIGYENRILAARDFNDDTKDAGEIGAGHTVTAFYEVIPAGEEPDNKEVDELEFQKPLKPSKAAKAGDMMVVKLRYKKPDEDKSQLLKMNVANKVEPLAEKSRDFRFASAVASFGMILRGSKFAGHANYDSVLELAEESLGENPESYRSEFVELVKQAKSLDQRK
ncbi:MAG: VWA domain-containing protein [Planctomycetaceae bacterium]|nr:VWA domain-containing protein [Planctomycetaceae bacterium]